MEGEPRGRAVHGRRPRAGGHPRPRREEVTDEKFTASNLVSADPDVHVRKLALFRELGATAIVLINASGAAPGRMIEFYGADVLPHLREPA